MRVVHILGAKNKKPNASIVAQIHSLRRRVDVTPLIYEAGHIGGYWRALREMKAILKAGDVHVVHGHHSRSAYLAIWACADKIPIVVSFLGTDLYNMGTANRLAYRSVIRRATAVIVKSERMRALITERQDVHVIPNGVDMSLFKPMDRFTCRKRLGLDTNYLYVLFAADPERVEKNFSLAQSAMEWLKARYRVSDCVLLPVYGVPQEILAEYINACNCMILSSEYEGSPNVVKEAMACNVPIVSTDVGDVRELVNNTANCHVVAHDSRLLGDALYNVLSHEGPTDGRARVEHLSVERVAHIISNIYQSIT